MRPFLVDWREPMQILRRILGWSLFLGFLGAVGFGVFHFVRYRPRCTIPELLFVRHLSADGSQLVTTKPPGLGKVRERGPLQIWDTHRGRVVNEFLGDVAASCVLSPDKTQLAAGLGDGTLHLVDWRSGQDWQIEDVKLAPPPESPPWPQYWFSPKGRWLFISDADNPGVVVNVATKKVVMRPKEKFL